ncbi:hypothetical protein CTEN210_00297 [Chaetoceros tenuissimus]|uniref:Leucine-rich repeat domain-containing protein n=1 Tax=Chaetoceros tenuissimus TaxID=426638 RepID=A0AAD3CDU7_9STRA|nr:hypothetical protein CTEN210_00297 [Chaetoceros tenuissimus]
MRVATVDDLVTLFYDGSNEFYNEDLQMEWESDVDLVYYENFDDVESSNLSIECKNYIRERQSWQQVIIVEGVTEIPETTFYRCYNINRVNFTNTIIRIRRNAFCFCSNLTHIKLPINLEYVKDFAFAYCKLSSVFVPPSCRVIGAWAFQSNENLEILHVPQNTELDRDVIDYTELFESSPNREAYKYWIEIDIEDASNPGDLIAFFEQHCEEVKAWLKDTNTEEEFALHRICSSYEPTFEMILDNMIERGGPKAFKVKNSIGITPSRYLKENPYTNVTEKEVIEKYVLNMMGKL